MRRLGLPVIAAAALALAVLGAPSLAVAKRVALVVGIDQYEYFTPAQQLRKAVSDSRAVGETLRSLGYEVQQADNVGRMDFLRQWQQFLNRIEPGDEAAFFFAGHGVEISGMNFLLPADVPRVASGEEELLKASAISLAGFLEQTRDRKPQMTLYVIDACRDNPFSNSAGRSIGGTRGLTLIEPPTGTFVMFSAGAGETALDRLSDSDSNPNSIYTRTLIPRLKTPGRIGDIARDVRRDVYKLASRVNHVQTPAFYDEVMGDFCPAGCMEAKAEPAKPQPPDPALEAWNATRSTESIDVLSAYVAKYKDSFYAEIAKARIEELKRRQQLATVASPKPQKTGPDPALEAWNAIKDTQDIGVLETFIGKYPLSFYAELARVHLSGLKQKQQAALVAPPPPKIAPLPPDPALQAWNEAKATESVSALEAFVARYPKSFYAELAKVRIDELERRLALAAAPSARDVVPGPDPAVEAWNEAKGSDNTSVLEGFVDKYPLSFHAQVAKARIEELRQKEDETARLAMVRNIQKALKVLECYSGAIDGVWSGASRDALEKFSRLARLSASVEEPGPGTLNSIRSWKGEHCAVEKIARPETEKTSPVVREQRKGAKTPKVAKTPKASSTAATKRSTKVSKEAKKASKPSSAADYDTPEKQRAAKKAGRTLEYDYGSVYCHQGCAGGFTGVLGGTARNSGMKR